MKTSAEVPAHARLQRRILAVLARGAVPSVVALATAVGAGRPSASRAVHQLEARGLAKCEDGLWQLTEAGGGAAEREARDLVTSAARVLATSQQTQREVQRRLPDGVTAGLVGADLVPGAAGSALTMRRSVPAGTIAGLMAGLESTNRSLVHGLTAQQALLAVGASVSGVAKLGEAAGAMGTVAAAAKFAGIAGGLEEANRSIIQGVGGDYKGLSSASSAALGALRLQTDILQGLAPLARSVVAANVALTGRIAADVDSIAAALPARRDLSRRSAGRLGDVVGKVVEAHRDVLIEVTPHLVAPETAPWETLLGTTKATSTVTSATRLLVLEETPVGFAEEPIGELVADVADQLAAAGATSAARDLVAAYEQQRRRPQGWEKATAHLQREAIRGTLDELAPPMNTPADGEGVVTKRAQLRAICGDDRTLAEWVDSTAASVGRLHSFLSAEAKRLAESRLGSEGHSGLLLVTAGLLRVVVDQAARKASG